MTCQQQKYTATTLIGLLQPVPLPEQVWDEATMNFIEGLPCSERVDTMLVVDRPSRYAHFIRI